MKKLAVGDIGTVKFKPGVCSIVAMHDGYLWMVEEATNSHFTIYKDDFVPEPMKPRIFDIPEMQEGFSNPTIPVIELTDKVREALSKVNLL